MIEDQLNEEVDELYAYSQNNYNIYLLTSINKLFRHLDKRIQMPKGNKEVYSMLIKEVQSRECLYVPTHPQYKDRQKLETEWAEIGKILGVSGFVAKKTWQNLRSSYTRCLAGEKTPGNSRKSSWYLKDQMEFLREYMSTMVSFDSSRNHNGYEGYDDMGPSAEELVDCYIKEEVKEQGESSNDSLSSSYFSPPIAPPAPKKLKTSTPTRLTDSSVPVTDTLLRLLTTDSDDDLVFLKGLIPTVRQLTPQNNRRFKRSITNYLFDLLEAQETPVESAERSSELPERSLKLNQS